ncbi:hypothetical protein BDF21DRAFT_400860 [Thamnidium elegans]|nr:hypothetical protein BDF21DRAFT_400860 [Thamnidium elegans]
MYIKIASFQKSNRPVIFIAISHCRFEGALPLLIVSYHPNFGMCFGSFQLQKKKLSSVVSLISGFISRRCFPRISFAKITLPRKSGSLGLLNPFIQKVSLQLRWLLLLLNLATLHYDFWTTNELQQSTVLPLLADYVIYHLELPCHTTILNSDYRLSFRFQDIRPSRLVDRDSPMYLLFQAIDSLPKDFYGVVTNWETALQISATIKPKSLSIVHKSLLKLSVQDVYSKDPITRTTRPRVAVEATQYPRLFKKFLKPEPRLTQKKFREKCLMYPEVFPGDLPISNLNGEVSFIDLRVNNRTIRCGLQNRNRNQLEGQEEALRQVPRSARICLQV